MNAADYVIIPVESGFYSYIGLEKMIDKVNSINVSTNKKLRVLGIVLNKCQRTSISKSVASSIKSEYENLAFKTHIPFCPSQAENAAVNQSSLDVTKSLGNAFSALTDEIIERIENNNGEFGFTQNKERTSDEGRAN